MKIFLSLFILFGDRLAWSDQAQDNHQCVVDICGPARENIGWMPRAAELTPELEAEVQKSLDTTIRDVVKTRMKTKLQVYLSLDKLLRRFMASPVTDVERAFVNIAVVSALVSRLLVDESNAVTKTSDSGNLSIREGPFFAKYPDLNDEEGKKLILSFGIYASNPTVRYMQQIDSNIPIELFYKYQRDFDKIGDLSTLSLALLQKLSVLDSEGLGEVITKSQRSLLSQIQASGELPEVSQKLFIQTYTQLNTLSIFSNPNLVSVLSSARLTADQIRSALQLDEVSKRGRALRDSQEGQEKIINDAKIKLSHAVRSMIASGVTTSEKEVASKVFEDERAVVVRLIESQATSDPNQLQIVRDAVASAQFKWPPSQRKLLASVAARLKDDVISDQAFFEQIVSLTDSGPHFAGLFADSVMNIGNFLRQETFSLEAVVESYSPPVPLDASYNLLRDIRLSWQSVKEPRYGVGIVGHEFGHLISSLLSYQLPSNAAISSLTGISRAKVCSVQRHIESNSLFDEKQIYYQAEEDWADIFGDAVMRSYAEGPAKPLNYMCLTIGIREDKKDYPSSIGMLNSFDGDIHSSSFYRLIQIQRDIGILPDSCVRAVKLQKNSDFFRSCIHED